MESENSEADRLVEAGARKLHKHNAFKELWVKVKQLVDESVLPLFSRYLRHGNEKMAAVDFAQFLLDTFGRGGGGGSEEDLSDGGEYSDDDESWQPEEEEEEEESEYYSEEEESEDEGSCESVEKEKKE